MPDAGYLQEEEARFANKHHYSKHKPACALYTEQDALNVLKQFKPLVLNSPNKILTSIGCPLSLMLTQVGHILGACAVHLDDGHKCVVFSGDVGRYNDRMMYDPVPVVKADVLVVESTYGDRLHKDVDTESDLQQIICDTVARGGSILIPSFAVGRAQLVLFYLMRLIRAKRIPKIPIFLNSPMAISATEIYQKFHQQLKLSKSDCIEMDKITHYIRTAQESVSLNKQSCPAIIISASGMASGGRVLHHMKSLISDHRNSVVFTGYQAAGTRGQAIVNGATEIKIHGQYYPVKAQVYDLAGLSAHGDYNEIINWLSNFKSPPYQVFVTHGASAAADAMRLRIIDKLGWSARVPELGETIEI